jgi:nicotinate phosphoribosyltransferase
MPDPNDAGLLSPAQASLLIDQYELAMAASYLKRGMDQPAVFELFARHLPPRRRWLLAAGIGPALALVRQIAFGDDELEYVSSLGFGDPFLNYWRAFTSAATSTQSRKARSSSTTSRCCA